MSLSNDQIIEAISAKSLIEVMELVKAMEEKFGVSAAAPVAMAAAPGCRRRCRSGRRADRIHGHPQGHRREEGRSHQGRPCDHRPWPQGSQGSRRVGSGDRQGCRQQGRRREVQEGPGSRRRDRRGQVRTGVLIPDSTWMCVDPGSSASRRRDPGSQMKTQHAGPISSGSARSESWIDPNFSSRKLQIPAEPGRESARALAVVSAGNREWGIGNRWSAFALFDSPFSDSHFPFHSTQAAARPPHAVEVRSS